MDQSEERKIIRSRRCRTGAPHPLAIRTIMVRLHTFNAGEQP
ncbi:putrescine transport ATP-binding PotG domain protein [Escherichia coli 6-319-05_S3_C2]|nr:putrescine transport ATP-binding PotG domain protein [Escherichia coli 6-319-05_S3_C2]